MDNKCTIVALHILNGLGIDKAKGEKYHKYALELMDYNTNSNIYLAIAIILKCRSEALYIRYVMLLSKYYYISKYIALNCNTKPRSLDKYMNKFNKDMKQQKNIVRYNIIKFNIKQDIKVMEFNNEEMYKLSINFDKMLTI